MLINNWSFNPAEISLVFGLQIANLTEKDKIGEGVDRKIEGVNP
jgi:hypothetical protein